MSDVTMTVELTDTEWRLVEAALHSFLSDFGHDEAELIEQIRSVLAKLPHLPDPAPAR
jgi:hypothetical protein